MNERLILLEALEEAGVDNWEGYSFAMDIFKEKRKEVLLKDKLDNVLHDIFIDCHVESDSDLGYNIIFDGDKKKLYKLLKDFVAEVEEW